MKTLCMDSAHRHLIIVLIEDGEVKTFSCQECWKKQSETLFPELIKLMSTIGWTADDLTSVVISDGPGSYTGVRIAMTVAKVLCTRKQIPLYCLSTLQLYAGITDTTMVMLDARSNRAYTAIIKSGEFIQEEGIQTIDEIRQEVSERNLHVIGDTDLINIEKVDINFVQNFAVLLPYAKQVANIHTLTPRYLKEQDAYKVK